jgi:hypothetical protein
VPPGQAYAATLLILREFMHHLGYDTVTLANPGAGERA